MDKTLKLRAYPDGAMKTAEAGKPADEKSLELAMKDAQIEEERSRSLEHLKTIVQLRESLKQEQARTAEATLKAGELEARLKDAGSQEAGERAQKVAQLEEEKKRSIEYMRMIEQLRESLSQEQAGVAEMADKLAALEARTGEIAVLEARITELSNALGKITAIATSVKSL
jgi:polyribonucleotide nucleotidyltransferase